MANWFAATSLSGRLSLLLALVVVAVVTSVAYLEVRTFAQGIEGEILEAGRSTAQAVAENLATHQTILDPLDMRDTLHDFVAADPVVHAISVIGTDGYAGPARVLTSTSTEERAEVVSLAKRVLSTRHPESDRQATAVTFVVPVPQHDNDAVAVTVGLESLLQARAHGARIALGFALPTVLLLTLLVYASTRRLVQRPIGAILQTMNATASGDWGARVAITRRDELGTIASGLNSMLDRLEQLNQTLQDRVEAATRDLVLRNRQLAASRDQLFVLREALAQAERVAALGQAAANTAHQVGTPLNLVSGYVQMLRDDVRVDPKVRARLQTVDVQIQQVIRVLRTMLDHARQPAGFEPARIADIIARVQDVAAPRLSHSGIELQVSTEESLPVIRADATQLEMALLNLVTNALDVMPRGGTLSIAATRAPTGVRLEISDTGPGIASSIVDRLFEPWVTTKPAGRGTGLGLAIVRNVVRAHGGSVSASNRPQGGAVFSIELPASAALQEASLKS